jgi:hypothetical protein
MAMLISTQARSVPPNEPEAPADAVGAGAADPGPDRGSDPEPAHAVAEINVAVSSQARRCRRAERTDEVSGDGVGSVNISRPFCRPERLTSYYTGITKSSLSRPVRRPGYAFPDAATDSLGRIATETPGAWRPADGPVDIGALAAAVLGHEF